MTIGGWSIWIITDSPEKAERERKFYDVGGNYEWQVKQEGSKFLLLRRNIFHREDEEDAA